MEASFDFLSQHYFSRENIFLSITYSYTNLNEQKIKKEAFNLRWLVFCTFGVHQSLRVVLQQPNVGIPNF